MILIRDAIVSPDGKYRYVLWREWHGAKNKLSFVMLNPSTADALQDDPTIRKCIGFAERAGYGGIVVYNLFAFRATDPRRLHTAHSCGVDVVGEHNDRHLGRVQPDADVCFAWGAHGRRYPERVAAVKHLLGHARWLCLGRVHDGNPAHPLMLPYTCTLQEYAE